MPEETRTKILYRLRSLQGEGLIKGKMVGAVKEHGFGGGEMPFE